MHNMMVEERIGNDKMESDSFYAVLHQATDVDSLDNDDSSEDMNGFGDNTIVGNFDTTSVRESILKYKIVQECWNCLLYTSDAADD